MLVLTRRVDEEIVTSNGIRIVIVGVRGGSIRVGVEAPPDVTVHRKEVADAIERERRKREDQANDDQKP